MWCLTRYSRRSSNISKIDQKQGFFKKIVFFHQKIIQMKDSNTVEYWRSSWTKILCNKHSFFAKKTRPVSHFLSETPEQIYFYWMLFKNSRYSCPLFSAKKSKASIKADWMNKPIPIPFRNNEWSNKNIKSKEEIRSTIST